MFWGSGGAVCGCEGGICKTEPAGSGALVLTSCFVVFLEEAPFVMYPWVCQRSPATSSAVASLPVASSVYFMESRKFCGQFLVTCPLRGDGVVLIPVWVHPKQCPGDSGTAGMGLGQGGTSALEQC